MSLRGLLPQEQDHLKSLMRVRACKAISETPHKITYVALADDDSQGRIPCVYKEQTGDLSYLLDRAETLKELVAFQASFLGSASCGARVLPDILRYELVSLPSGESVLCSVLRWVEGAPLHDLMLLAGSEESPLQSLGDVVGVCAQIAAVLAKLENAISPYSLVHGDIKPSNIIVRFEDSGSLSGVSAGSREPLNASIFSCTFIDFDLLQLQYRGVAAGESMRFGTVGYAAPELYDASPHYSSVSDVYALGVLVHELLTGELPYADSLASSWSFAAWKRAMCVGPFESCLRVCEALPSELKRLLKACLARQPELRPAALEVAERLARVAADFNEAPLLRPACFVGTPGATLFA